MEKKATDLRVNAAQMRTRLSADKLAQLCVSIKEAGMDPTMPIVVFGNEVVSGHRRWLALMLTTLMLSPSVRDAQKVIRERLEVEGGYIQLTPGIYQALAEVTDVTVAVVEFKGDEREAVLALLRAGGGAEDPDLLGLSRAFTVALGKGVTQRKLARTHGVSESKVKMLVALGQADKRLAQLIQDGQVPLRICRHLKPGSREQGFVEAILDRRGRYSDRPLKADELVKAAKAVQGFHGFQAKLEAGPLEWNRSRAYNVLWERLLEQDAVAVWTAVAGWALWGREVSSVDQGGWLLALDDEENPWYTRQSRYGYQAEFDLVAMAALLPDLRCETCVIQNLPRVKLQVDLDFPCRKGPKFEGHHGCLAYVAEDQPFSIKVPHRWDVPDREAKDVETLLAAYEKQKKEEAKKGPVGKAIQIQRDLIQAFMLACDEESDWDVDHLWATWCGRCRWHLDHSPTKNPDVPHCQWAARRRRLRFKLRLPLEKGTGKPIPLCLQYGPSQEDWWRVEMVPESSNPLTFPRPMIQRAIEQLDGRIHSYERSCLQFLIGTPLKSKDLFFRFSELLKKRIGDLSDAQLQTIFEWAMCEWMRACKHWQVKGYPLPVVGGYVIYTEVMWDG